MAVNPRDALQCLDAGMPREPWVRVAFAAKDAGITEDEWLAWCEGAGNFNRADAVSTWRNAKPVAGGVTAATLYSMARDAGYNPEARGRGGNGAERPSVPSNRPKAAPAEPETPPTDPRPIWDACRPVDVHGYLSRKQIKPHGARVNSGGWLVIPYLNRSRELQTLQTIAADGTKRFLAGAKAKGSVAILGEPEGAKVVAIAEGWATAAAIEEATGFPALAAGSRVTLVEGARIARHFAPDARLVVAADRGDLSTPIAAARAVGGFLAAPGGEDAPDGFDFADWKLDGATDAQILACIERAPPVPSGDDDKPARPALTRPTAAAKVAAKADVAPAEPLPYLIDGRGRIVPNLANIVAWMATGAVGDFKLDTFTGLLTWNGAPVDDAALGAMTCLIQGAFVRGMQPFHKVAIPSVADAVIQAANANSYNSCIDWLDTLPEWDATERCARFFCDVAELEATDYALAVGRYFWHGLVARMVKPGVQVDSAVTLIGPQGIGKSSLARIIGGERYGEAGLHDIGSRDWCGLLRGKVVVEISELSGHSRAELEVVKAVLTRTADEYRAPYARTSSHIPRGNVFIATTNEPDFLIDASGNRRWLPVQCKAPFNLDALRSMRDQLFAEAYRAVRVGLPSDWYIVPGSADVQASHVARDPWIDVLDEKLRSEADGELPTRIANTAVYQALGIPTERQSGGGTGRRIAAAMRSLGFDPSRWHDASRTRRGFVRPVAVTVDPDSAGS